jgi:hypothetical protein
VLKRPAPGLSRTAGLKKDQACTFSGVPCVKGPIINYMKETKVNSNCVKTYYSKSCLKGQTHFSQLKEYLHKNSKAKKGPVLKFAEFPFQIRQ